MSKKKSFETNLSHVFSSCSSIQKPIIFGSVFLPPLIWTQEGDVVCHNLCHKVLTTQKARDGSGPKNAVNSTHPQLSIYHARRPYLQYLKLDQPFWIKSNDVENNCTLPKSHIIENTCKSRAAEIIDKLAQCRRRCRPLTNSWRSDENCTKSDLKMHDPDFWDLAYSFRDPSCFKSSVNLERSPRLG